MPALPYEWQIGWRLVRAQRGEQAGGFVSFIAATAMLGITLGVAALIVVLSVVNGFQREVRDRMLDVVPQVDVHDLSGVTLFGSPELAARLRAWPGVRGVAPFVQLPALLGRGDGLRGALLRGIDPAQDAQVSSLTRRLAPGLLARLQPGSLQVVLGRELARTLDVQPGQSVTLVRPALRAGDAPRLVALTVAGLLDSGHFEYDSTLALMHLQDVATLAERRGASGLGLRLDDPQQAPAVAAALRRTLGDELSVGDWTRTNRSWFESVQIQKRMIGLILALIVAVAAFNLTSMLVMTVTDRRGDIAILRTLGASPASVMGIFMVQGAASGIVGTAGGLLLGLGVAFNLDHIVPAIEALAGRRLLEAQVYLIDHLPSDPRAAEVAWIAAVSLALALLATLYPSWRASRVDPAEALRHE
jgi:lipoprotein-releasing system permease protein